MEDIDATCLQVRRAYEYLFGRRIPGDVPYTEIARRIVAEIGHDKAKAAIEGQSNDPNAPEPPIREDAT